MKRHISASPSYYDSILLDYEMPRTNGPSAAAQMRELGCTSNIIGLTGNVLPEDSKYFKECGANWVLHKPLRMPDLEAAWKQFGVTGCCQERRTTTTSGDDSLSSGGRTHERALCDDPPD